MCFKFNKNKMKGRVCRLCSPVFLTAAVPPINRKRNRRYGGHSRTPLSGQTQSHIHLSFSRKTFIHNDDSVLASQAKRLKTLTKCLIPSFPVTFNKIKLKTKSFLFEGNEHGEEEDQGSDHTAGSMKCCTVRVVGYNC